MGKEREAEQGQGETENEHEKEGEGWAEDLRKAEREAQKMRKSLWRERKGEQKIEVNCAQRRKSST